jgi:hypothetical protein
MINNIHIDNYEAFYLDYLEGNLSESDAALLLAFLANHPELELDDDLLYLDEANDISFPSKSSLYVFDENAAIASENVEQFMVAHVERQLSGEKENELQNFVGSHTHLAKDLDLYRQSILVPDLSLEYPNKASLKKKVVPIYSLFSMVASIAAIFILFFLLYPDKPNQLNTLTASKKTLRIKEQKSQVQAKVPEVSSEILLHAAVSAANLSTPKAQTKVNPIPLRKLHVLNARPLMQEPLPIEYGQITNKYKSENQTYASKGVQEMKNPIKPVTNKLAEVMKTDVDFRTAHAKLSFKGGFYLKIGKLEISRKVYEKESLAVTQ